jgi:hypothetical protein
MHENHNGSCTVSCRFLLFQPESDAQSVAGSPYPKANKVNEPNDEYKLSPCFREVASGQLQSSWEQ